MTSLTCSMFERFVAVPVASTPDTGSTLTVGAETLIRGGGAVVAAPLPTVGLTDCTRSLAVTWSFIHVKSLRAGRVEIAVSDGSSPGELFLNTLLPPLPSTSIEIGTFTNVVGES